MNNKAERELFMPHLTMAELNQHEQQSRKRIIYATSDNDIHRKLYWLAADMGGEPLDVFWPSFKLATSQQCSLEATFGVG